MFPEYPALSCLLYTASPPPPPFSNIIVGNGSLRAAFAVGCALPLFFFLSHICSVHTFLPVYNFPQAFHFHQVITINHGLYPHLRGFTPLRKILTVNPHRKSLPRRLHFQQSLTVPHYPPLSPTVSYSPWSSTPTLNTCLTL